MISSLDEQTPCDICGKGLIHGRPLIRARLKSVFYPGHERVVWVCLFCAEGRWKREVTAWRRTYRRQYNERHFKEMAEALRFLAPTKVRTEFFRAYDQGLNIPPAVLAEVRNDFMRIP
jgi:hypothetical protein